MEFQKKRPLASRSGEDRILDGELGGKGFEHGQRGIIELCKKVVAHKGAVASFAGLRPGGGFSRVRILSVSGTGWNHTSKFLCQKRNRFLRRSRPL